MSNLSDREDAAAPRAHDDGMSTTTFGTTE
jgi:hypothetical protein